LRSKQRQNFTFMRNEPELHRLILVYGPGCGLGKSTLSIRLFEQVRVQGFPARLVREEEVLRIPEFSEYVRQVENGNGDDSATLLDCCRAFVADLERRQPEISVLDSILPCWDWLFTAKCTYDVVESFSQNLSDLMRELEPILVYVEGDIQTALSRAIADRGETWALNLAKARTGKRQIADLMVYLTELRSAADAMVESWYYDTIRVNTIENSVEEAVNEALDTIRLQHNYTGHN
jgi:hypothetical protein